jgi:UDP-N-acetylmuramoyl-L-alanyl-D-glutamate--2,6-diaminopimelate ligase
LDQFRVFGVNYDVGVVTNVTNEHLDYHKTWDRYVAAKGKLLRNVEISVLNKDDKSYEPMVRYGKGSRILTYSLSPEADFYARDIDMVPERVTFKVNTMDTPIASRLIGWYNVQNMLAAVAVAQHYSVGESAIVEGLGRMAPPPGRLQLIDEGQDFTVIVDFAHTSNALDSVLKMLHDIKTHRLIVVFGCAGERDPFKRYPMGASAGKYADITVITAEDPRSEDLNHIMAQVAEGVEAEGGVYGDTYYKIGDRYDAIQFAIKQLAQPGDIVVTTGKAHEQSMNYDGVTETPWDEFGAVRDALQARQQTAKG